MSASNSRPIVLVIDDSPTILKVVQLVLTKAGFEVRTTLNGEAGLAAARAERPQLLLLDFVMPQMNGYQVCREFSADAELRNIPIVLMSAKGDQIGERFIKVMGIVDYITKPFSPEAITAVVSHSIAKYSNKASAPPDSLRPVTAPSASEKNADNDIETTIPGLAQRTTKGIDDAHRATTIATIATAIADRIIATLPRESDQKSDDQRRMELMIQAAGQVLSESHLLRPNDNSIESQMPGHASLQGDLRVVPLAEILLLLDTQKQDGTLFVHRDDSSIEVYFRRGRIDMARAQEVSDEFLLGRFIINQELLSPADLADFLESRPPNSTWMGTQLIKLGYLSEAELRGALRQQSSELIYEVLRWSHGTFHFKRSSTLPNMAVDAKLGLDVEGILMEGFRRVDEWHLIEREIDDFDMIFLRNEDSVAQMGRGRLSREELAVLELVNGKNTVKEIVRTSRMGSFDVSKMLFRLLSIKLIRRRVMPIAV